MANQSSMWTKHGSRHRKPFKSCGLIGPKKLQWTSLLGKITLPVPTKTSIALEKKIIMFQVNAKSI